MRPGSRSRCITARACGGHERVWLPEKDRAVAREMRMAAAREGLRAPVQVLDGNYKLMSGTCAWWDEVKQ